MGDAVRRRDLGPTRTIEVRRQDLIDLIRFLTEMQQKTDKDGNPVGQPRPKLTSGRADRLALKRALTSIGAMKIWNVAHKPGGASQKELEDSIPARLVVTLTEAEIDILLTRLEGERDMTSSLNLVQLEEDLELAKHGFYELPPQEAVEAPPTPAAAPSTGAP